MGKRHLKIKTRGAEGTVAEVYRQIRGDFGVLGEPLTLHAVIPELLAGVWASFRESALAGQVPRKYKEAAAVAVSKLNQCPYCIDAHAVMLRATKEHDAAAAIQEGQPDRIKEPRVRAYAEWAMATRSPGSALLASPPFSAVEAPEIIGTALWIHYINRMTKLLLGGALIPIRSNLLGLRALSERMGGLFFTSAVERRLAGGASLNTVPETPAAPDFGWTSPSPTITRAFAAFALAAENAGSKYLAKEVRAAVQGRLNVWDGSAPGFGRAWMEPELMNLPDELRPAGRLALIAALAPDQAGDDVIRGFRQRSPGDAALVGAVAWSSFAAARTIGKWMAQPGLNNLSNAYDGSPNRPGIGQNAGRS
jgi:AhpD family alkylhydroperoxidase